MLAQIDLALAEMAGISLSELYRLNPAFNRWPPIHRPHHLLLPLDSITPFKQQLASAKKDRLRCNSIVAGIAYRDR